MVKWTAQELLDTFNKETNLEELNELYKALIAYNLGCTTIEEDKLNEVLEYYYSQDFIYSIINQDVIDYANEILEQIH